MRRYRGRQTRAVLSVARFASRPVESVNIGTSSLFRKCAGLNYGDAGYQGTPSKWDGRRPPRFYWPKRGRGLISRPVNPLAANHCLQLLIQLAGNFQLTRTNVVVTSRNMQADGLIKLSARPCQPMAQLTWKLWTALFNAANLNATGKVFLVARVCR